LVENKNNNKRVIIVGIPGVGKTSIVSLVAEKLGRKEIKATVAVFGTVMLKLGSEIETNCESCLWQSRDDFKKWLRKELQK
jgi:adenylate kinase